jgi:hypothetical protein
MKYRDRLFTKSPNRDRRKKRYEIPRSPFSTLIAIHNFNRTNNLIYKNRLFTLSSKPNRKSSNAQILEI